ncbi:hypothetical protein PCANC_10096 [Puccinia coronata f. sp. avenae]|uniref:Uncharacterized protein n=1 Tax=Puccinia coronata f. sp. avenae TaxID=200324 RepID=A0A2N5SLV7_9BASI|nr:hypothetical protein PCANC_17843 [Puccinia coronata f. sp. avenae]PLW17816.1 hypothetical protein PCASD_19218 [Puccinia coronata f. sp. avenae]PLW44618.1 hypothetical protein PCASD_05166 [Puccinia coronata f. sp. avenae]PLW45852.1 hypothetical protein PCANC_10096 [Puccinia coronata f. sp. avenae]
MGKSAKCYKRPTRKEKMGLSSNTLLKNAIATSKFNKPEPTNPPKHKQISSTNQKKRKTNKAQ